MKIVIIAAAFYPRLSPRANRAKELAKELARTGHDVTVYSVLGNYDYSKFEKTHNLKVRNLGKTRFSTYTSDENCKKAIIISILSKLFRRSLEFPDIELSFKVAKILKRERDVDLLITIAFPFPIHWGTAYAKKYFSKNNINTWVADCGDPFMGNKFLKHLFYFKYIEKWFCKKVDYLSIPIEEARSAYYKEFHTKIRVIPQGFNFDEVKIPKKVEENKTLTFIYAGIFYKGIRDPRSFLDYLCELNSEFKFIVFTKSRRLIKSYKEKLKDKLDIRDYVSRLELINIMSQADFLVNFENNTEVQSPSKLIDYALSGRPILSVKPLQIDKVQINEFLKRNYINQLVVKDLENYDIKNVANKFIQLKKEL